MVARMMLLIIVDACRPARARPRMCVRLTTWGCLLMVTATPGAFTGFGLMVVSALPPVTAPQTV